MRPTGRDVEGTNLGTLILAYYLRLERVWSLKPRPGHRQIEMESVRIIRLPIEAIKGGFRIAMIVDWNKFGRIEKAAIPSAAQRDKISPPCSSGPICHIFGPVPKGTVLR